MICQRRTVIIIHFGKNAETWQSALHHMKHHNNHGLYSVVFYGKCLFFSQVLDNAPIHGWWSSQLDLLVLLAEVIRPIPVWPAESGLGTGEWQTQQTQVLVWREIYWEKIKQWPRVAEQVDQKVMLCCGKNWKAGYCDIAILIWQLSFDFVTKLPAIPLGSLYFS